MPKCVICSHPDRDAIDRDLVAGVSLRIVAERRGTSRSALFRHKRDHIPAQLARVAQIHNLAAANALAAQVDRQEAEAHARGLDVMAELERAFARVNKLFDACDAWLTDPDHPDRYDLGPRAEEVLVHYTLPGKSAEPIRAKAPLSELLARAGSHDPSIRPIRPNAPTEGGDGSAALAVDRLELKTADPRELILKAARRLEAELQLVARLVGQLQEAQPTVNVLVTSPEWIATRTAILAALEPYPDARAAVAGALAVAAPNA